jgi:hypothetical protein
MLPFDKPTVNIRADSFLRRFHGASNGFQLRVLPPGFAQKSLDIFEHFLQRKKRLLSVDASSIDPKPTG